MKAELSVLFLFSLVPRGACFAPWLRGAKNTPSSSKTHVLPWFLMEPSPSDQEDTAMLEQEPLNSVEKAVKWGVSFLRQVNGSTRGSDGTMANEAPQMTIDEQKEPLKANGAGGHLSSLSGDSEENVDEAVAKAMRDYELAMQQFNSDKVNGSAATPTEAPQMMAHEEIHEQEEPSKTHGAGEGLGPLTGDKENDVDEAVAKAVLDYDRAMQPFSHDETTATNDQSQGDEGFDNNVLLETTDQGPSVDEPTIEASLSGDDGSDAPSGIYEAGMSLPFFAAAYDKDDNSGALDTQDAPIDGEDEVDSVCNEDAHDPEPKANSGVKPLTEKVSGDDIIEEESLERLKEYKSTSMKELRQNVGETQEKSLESKQRVESMQAKVDALRIELEAAESEFQQYMEIRNEENDSIVSRVDELETLLRTKVDERKADEDKLQVAARERQESLLKELNESRAALRDAEAAMVEERDAFAQIQARLVEAQEQLSREKDAFESDEAKLSSMIKDEISKIMEAERRIQKEREEFKDQKLILGKKLQEKITSVAETNARIQLERSLFGMNQAEVQKSIDKITAELRKLERKLESDENKELSELQNAADELRVELKKEQKKLGIEQAKTLRAKEDMEMRLVFEVIKAKKVSTEISKQQSEFQREINELERASSDTRARLADAEAQLAITRAALAEDTQALEDQIVDGERIRKLKAKQMSQRYSDMREEMTAKWQSERRRTRNERTRLDEKYKTKLSSLRDKVPHLERELAEARRLTEYLRVRAESTALDKVAIVKDIRMAESRHIRLTHERNTAISALEGEVKDLLSDLAEREEKLALYKSSLRTMLGLGLKLTKKRIGAAGTRLLYMIRFKRKPTTSSRNPTQLLNTKRVAVTWPNEQFKVMGQ